MIQPLNRILIKLFVFLPILIKLVDIVELLCTAMKMSPSLIKKWMKNHKVVLLILNPFNGCVSIFCGPKKCKKKNSGKNVDYFLLITSPASLWFMLSRLFHSFTIFYTIFATSSLSMLCNFVLLWSMDICIYRSYIYIHGKISSIGINHTHILIHMYTFRKLLLLLLSTT